MNTHNAAQNQAGRFLGQRGVAFLFQAYLIAFWCLVLVGAMFMRSSAELEQARFDIETQQAFWLAEMGVDEIAYGLKVNPPTLSANQCTKPILRIMSASVVYPAAASVLVGTNPLSNGTSGYTAQVCRTVSGEYNINSAGVGGTRGTSRITTLVNVPSNNLKFPQALLAMTSITLQQGSVAEAVEQATDLSQGGSFQAPKDAMLSNADIATLAKTSPTTK